MQYEEGIKAANEVARVISPYCDRVDLGGSLRRGMAVVGDVEIICLPHHMEQHDFFGTVTGITRPKAFVLAMQSLGEILSGDIETGRYVRLRTTEGADVDVFMPQKQDYFRQLVIRTGSAEWVTRVVAGGWRKCGWVGTEDGLRLHAECRNASADKQKPRWVCNVPNPQVPPAWDSELAFFRWLGIDYKQPNERY
jgi:hypothetical protein